MNKSEAFFPTEENLGKNYRFWDLNGQNRGCNYPKAEMTGRTSCEGIVDDVCLYLRIKRQPPSLSEKQLIEIKTRVPGFRSNRNLPTGDIK